MRILIKVVATVLLVNCLYSHAFASNGIDTVSGTKNLPFNLEGNQVMMLDEGTGLTVDKGVVAGGPVHPGTNGVSVGGDCITQGDGAFDLKNDQPVYCNNKHIWISNAGASPSGTLCGYYSASAYSGEFLQTYSLCQGSFPSPNSSQGVMIQAGLNGSGVSSYGCPSGYTFKLVYTSGGGSGMQALTQISLYSCVKD